MLERHLWQGDWIDDVELDRRLSGFSEWAAATTRESLEPRIVLDAAQAYSAQLHAKTGNYKALKECLLGIGMEDEAEAMLTELADFLDRDNLETKLRRELGSTSPFLPARMSYTDSIFEAWAPLGLLVHAAPSNFPPLGPLSVIEGLLAGNVNFLKTGDSESLFPQLFLEGLFRCDATGTLARFVVAASVPSREKGRLARVFSAADGIAAWGGEEAAREIRRMAPSSARVVEWGHKILFIYIAKDRLGDDVVLENAARECCTFEQQPCSSPQCLYVETEEWSELERFAERFATILERIARATPRREPSEAESAEITLATELAREEASFGRAKVIDDRDKSWRILMDRRPALVTSPLFRTIWLKPLPRSNVFQILRPMRAYLQTVGLACGLNDIVELSGLFLKSGAMRVRCVGEMTGSYAGEPHDGVYALQRYCRRVSLQLGEGVEGFSSFSDLRWDAPSSRPEKMKIMTKADFQAMTVDERHAQLYFKSGGSTGEPKLSTFSYDDYHDHMRAGAEGLYAAGLDPLKDRCMNLFYGGNLYGGFLSVFSVLEELRAVHFPMAAQTDFAMVADSIVKNKIDVLLGMPSYLVQLFEQQKDALRCGAKIKKIFYGGEHLSEAQRRALAETFGIELIRSVGYGSVDAGPLGYQCRFCADGAHHLHQRLQYLEILDLESDEPATGETPGRLVFTSRARRGQTLARYDLGDVGHWLAGPCACGRAAPRFRLLGRSGDVFRIGASFFNYERIATTLSDRLGYAGAVQVVLDRDGLLEKLTIRLSQEAGSDAANARALLLENDRELAEVVERDGVLRLDVTAVPPGVFEAAREAASSCAYSTVGASEMARWELAELVRFARERSPFYRSLYACLPERFSTIESLPIIDQGRFWKANGLENNSVLTGPMFDGIVFKSGGSTGRPKMSVFSKAEWASFSALFGRSLAVSNIQEGDRVANLFYAGELYGSFLFVTKSLEESPLGVLQLPIGGGASLQEMAGTIDAFGTNVIAGVPTTILNLAEHVRARGLSSRLKIERTLFGGEPLHPDQRERLSEVFPGIRALSIGYASTDAGPLGYADASCGPGEHRAFGSDTILEIVDEATHAPIREPGREGLLIATDLGRSLMPIIRYPVGDRGLWLEPEGARDRKFMLLGRSEEAAKIGMVKVYVEDVRKALFDLKQELGAVNFQLTIVHRDRLDGLVLRIAAGGVSKPGASAAEKTVRAVHAVAPLYERAARERKIHPIGIEWVAADELETNPRTGKTREIVDRRMTGDGWG